MSGRAWAWMLGAVLGLVGCSSEKQNLPPLEGLYRSPEGLRYLFHNDNTFQVENASGRFTVDGTHVVMTVRDRSMTAERVSADELVLSPQEGQPEGHLFRVGSTVAQSERASTPSKPPAATSRPIAPPPPSVDRSMPLERYAVLDATDPLAGRFLVAAFRTPALSDDEKLSALSAEGTPTTDAFARRDLIAKALPTINDRLTALKAQRYFRMDAQTDFQNGRPSLLTGGTPLMGHYDLERRGFPVACLEDGQVNVGGTAISFHGDAPGAPIRSCFLPVSDEALARRLESEISRTPLPVRWSATLYFAVNADAPHVGPQAVAATLTHATVRVLPSMSTPGRDEPPLASFDIDTPQPSP